MKLQQKPLDALLSLSEQQVSQRVKMGDLQMVRRDIEFVFLMSPAEVVEHFRLYYGPTQKAFESLDEKGQAELRRDLEQLWSEHNRVADGSTRVESEYLEVTATRG